MSEFNAFEIVQSAALEAPPERVWVALTAEIGKWWAYRIGEENSTFSVEARLGGRFEERWGDNEGVTLGEVVDIRRGKRLRLKGCLGMTGAAVNDWSYDLEPNGDGTRLTVTHHGIGYTDHETVKNYEEGWHGLLDSYLPAWLHDGETHDQVKAPK